jgi:hypothetical protein
MSEFGETTGDFVRNLLQSLQAEAERLPSPKAMMDSLKEFDPTPQQVTEMAAKCAEAVTAVGRALGGMLQGIQERSERGDPMPEHLDIPDDLSGL